MWGVFYSLEPRNQEKNWDIFINQYIFTLDYVKLYTKGTKRGSK